MIFSKSPTNGHSKEHAAKRLCEIMGWQDRAWFLWNSSILAKELDHLISLLQKPVVNNLSFYSCVPITRSKSHLSNQFCTLLGWQGRESAYLGGRLRMEELAQLIYELTRRGLTPKKGLALMKEHAYFTKLLRNEVVECCG